MPRGIANKKENADPEPLIIMQPAGDGWQFNAYGVDLQEVIRALRLSLIHFVAQQSGVTTIEAIVSPKNAVVATPAPAPVRRAPGAKQKPAQRSNNGRRPARPDDDDLDDEDLREMMEAR